MKQTAVEWLIQEYINGAFINIQIMKEALEMEKEQIVNAFEHVDFNLDDGLHYYEQTYESNT